VPPRRRLQVHASTAARASAMVCACLRPGPEGWRRSRQRAPLRAAPSRAELLIAARDDRLGRVLGEAQLAEDLGGERVGNGEHAEQDALVPERLPVARAGLCNLMEVRFGAASHGRRPMARRSPPFTVLTW
jgi:hypothetical protein